MSIYDKKYLEVAKDILQHGYYAENRTGIPTYKIPHVVMQFQLEREFPILTTKFVAFKTAIKEMLWIWQLQSNDVKVLQDMGVKVWNEWALPDGTIGKAYGYQIAKYKQLDNLIHTLKTNPQSRRMIVSLWNVEDLPEMSLQPCAFQTIWDVTEGRLNCMLIQRSGDWALGIPFNTSQYAVLTHLIAQVVGLKVGMLTHVISNAHIYENQVEGMKLQLSRETGSLTAPKLWINPKISDFYKFTIDDIKLIDYNHLGKIEMPVSV